MDLQPVQEFTALFAEFCDRLLERRSKQSCCYIVFFFTLMQLFFSVNIIQDRLTKELEFCSYSLASLPRIDPLPSFLLIEELEVCPTMSCS